MAITCYGVNSQSALSASLLYGQEKNIPELIRCSREDLTGIDLSVIFSERVLSVELLSGGYSGAKVFKISTGERGYVLRHSKVVEKLAKEFLLTEKMGKAGISPSVYFFDAEQGIIVMDFIPKSAGGSYSPDSFKSIPEKNCQLVQLIKQVHEYKELDPDIKEGVIPHVIPSLYADLDQKLLNKEELLILDRIIKSPWPQGKQTFVHNDLYSGNILYGSERFWIVDWELSGLGHPFYDLAFFANFQGMSQNEGIEVLNLYLNERASDSDIQEFHLMRRLAYGFNAIFRLSQASKANVDVKIPLQGEVELKMPIDLFRAIDEGTIDLSKGRDVYRAGIIFLHASASY